MPFEAIAYTSDGKDFISSPEWTWEFGDGDESAENPTEHAYAKEGIYTVVVTATAKEGTGTAETAVEVVGDGGGGDALVTNSLYMRDPVTKATLNADQACDNVEIVFQTTDVMAMSPELWRQSPPDVPSDTWHAMGTAFSENTGNPQLKRWYWGWITYSEKNWPVKFKVIYRRPRPPPAPPELITVGPVEWTPGNTAVHSGDEVLPWNGEDALTIPWTLTHANRADPKFQVTVFVYAVGGATPVKTIVLQNQSIGGGSAEWNGEVNQGEPPAEPGVYTYRVDAVHNALPMCEDSDKSTQLIISNVSVPVCNSEWLANTHPPQRRAQLEYDLSIDAETCRFEVFAPTCLHEVPIIDPSSKQLPTTAGHHALEVTFQVCPAHLGSYTSVIWADETATTGQNNTDLLPKHAHQDGATLGLQPPGLAAAGLFGDGGYLDQVKADAVAAAADAWRSMSPTWYTPTTGQGAGMADFTYSTMDEGPVGVVFTVSHATDTLLSFDNGTGSGQYDIKDSGANDPTNHVWSLSQLAGNDLGEMLFAFYMGCHTAGGGLLSATTGKGAECAAGFTDGITSEYNAVYASAFWATAVLPGATIGQAHAAGRDAVIDEAGTAEGYNSFAATNLGLQLYPARFAGTCVGAP